MTFAARASVKPTIERRRTCTKCGRLGHLVTSCVNQEKHHDKIGIEIEGWWHDLIGMQRKATELTGHPGCRDGSIRDIASCAGDDEGDETDVEDPDTEDCEEGCDDCPHPVERRTAVRCSRGKTDCRACGSRGWEFQTKPGSVGEALRQLTTLYPDVTSRAAGMHVHMSFREATSISLLCSEAFFKHWDERWRKWGTKNNVQGAFWERLKEGAENRYCKPNSMGHWQAKDLVTNNTGDRYLAINFKAYQEHKTVEFRLLPMFQKGNLATAAVEQLVDIVESYLQKAAFDTDISAPPTKISKNANEPVEMEPVNLDFDIPVNYYAPVEGEVELADTFIAGVQSPGTVRMFRYQVDAYLANASSDAATKKTQIADPKRNKVVWETFDPNPSGDEQ